jgi:hypothetical protein
MGIQIHALNASTIGEIQARFGGGALGSGLSGTGAFMGAGCDYARKTVDVTPWTMGIVSPS